MDFLHILFAAVGLLGGFGLGWMAFSSRISGLNARIAGLDELKLELEKAQREKTELHERAIKAEAETQYVQIRLKDQQEQLRAEFKLTADALLEQVSTKFSTQSEKKIGDLLNPMQQHLNDFKKLVVDSFTTQGKEQHTLKSEIGKIMLQADSLTKALRGDAKAQGNWGEIMLERILEESGLRRDEDYTLQAVDMGLKNADGSHLKPDVIVHLPDNKHIIIDSKVSLTAYERYCGESDEAARQLHIKEFLRSVKSHIVGLEGKRYQDIEALGTPDFVLLFMPTEGAFSFAMQHDSELHSYAWGRKIVLVSPTTLFATLKTIASLWNIERQNRYAQEIARQGGALYDKFAGFVENMDAVGKQLDKAQTTYDSAMKQLSTGRGNLIGSAEKLKVLGAKASKSITLAYDDMPEEETEKPRLSIASGD